MEMKPKEVAALKDWASFVKEKMAEQDALVKKVKPFTGIAATPIEVLAKELKKDIKSCAKEAAKETALAIKAQKISNQKAHQNYLETHTSTIYSHHLIPFAKDFRVWVTIHISLLFKHFKGLGFEKISYHTIRNEYEILSALKNDGFTVTIEKAKATTLTFSTGLNANA